MLVFLQVDGGAVVRDRLVFVVAVTISVYELSGVLKTVTERDPGLLNLAFMVVGAFFIILTLPMGVALGWVGKRVAVKR